MMTSVVRVSIYKCFCGIKDVLSSPHSVAIYEICVVAVFAGCLLTMKKQCIPLKNQTLYVQTGQMVGLQGKSRSKSGYNYHMFTWSTALCTGCDC